MSLTWQADFSTLDTLKHDFAIQAKDDSRVEFLTIAGRKAVRLHALPGDEGVVFAGPMRRCDLAKIVPGTQGPDLWGEGREMWIGHGIMFPDDFQRGTWQPNNVFDCHHSPEVGGSAPLSLTFMKDNRSPDFPGLLRLMLLQRDPNNPIIRNYYVPGDIDRNVWNDLLLHVRWSSKEGATTGSVDAWWNRVQFCGYRGPTLYPGSKVYMKLPHYFLPPTADTPASSLIHGQTRIGTTRASVEL